MFKVGNTYKTINGDRAVVVADIIENGNRILLGYVCRGIAKFIPVLWDVDGNWWTTEAMTIKDNLVAPEPTGKEIFNKIARYRQDAIRCAVKAMMPDFNTSIILAIKGMTDLNDKDAKSVRDYLHGNL